MVAGTKAKIDMTSFGKTGAQIKSPLAKQNLVRRQNPKLKLPLSLVRILLKQSRLCGVLFGSVYLIISDIILFNLSIFIFLFSVFQRHKVMLALLFQLWH